MRNKKGLILGGLLLLGIGFAAVSTTLYLKGNINISSNSEDFDVRFTKAVIDSEDRSNQAISEDGKTINFTTKELKALNDKSKLDFEVTNKSALYDAEVSIECTTGEKGEYYQITKEVASTIPSKTTDIGSVEVEKIKVTTEDIEESFTCTLTAKAKERTTKGEEVVKVNQNIVNQDLECLKNKEAGSCDAGTEIRYMVNESDEKTFYVLHDDGATLTLQQRENTINSIVWYSSEDNTKGPTIVLAALENATSGWSNVNTLNYTMGTTNLGGKGVYTGCSVYNSCTENTYTLGQRSGKARMITIQEAIAVGCTVDDRSCPVWLYDYLSSSKDNGGTTNYGTDYGYWTMNARSSLSERAWRVRYGGYVNTDNITSTNYGARAVVEISK